MIEKFGKEKSAEIFKALAFDKADDVARKFELDKEYKTLSSAAAIVRRVYVNVLNDPGLYAVEKEWVRKVKDAVTGRTVIKFKTIDNPENEKLSPTMMRIRDKAFGLVEEKLDIISKSKKKLEKVSFKELGTVAGIAFDKARILQGEATEHIALHSKIDKNLDPDEAMQLVLSMRESEVEDKEKQKRKG